jgi:hypothetical protein
MDFVLIIPHLHLVVFEAMTDWIAFFMMKLIRSYVVEIIELIFT